MFVNRYNVVIMLEMDSIAGFVIPPCVDDRSVKDCTDGRVCRCCDVNVRVVYEFVVPFCDDSFYRRIEMKAFYLACLVFLFRRDVEEFALTYFISDDGIAFCHYLHFLVGTLCALADGSRGVDGKRFEACGDALYVAHL